MKKIGAIAKTLGSMLMVFSLCMLPPALVSLIHDEGLAALFTLSAGATFAIGFFLWLANIGLRTELVSRDGFVVVLFSWMAFAVFAAFPLLLSGQSYGLVNSLFESVSGLTTTGATAIEGLDETPRTILFYRSMLQWFGGMGIIVLAVAVLPFLGVGGMQLYGAEKNNLLSENKFQPHIAQVAKSLWSIYAGLTVIVTFLYWSVGMDIFDAINHGMTTIASGGFSTHDASIGHYNNVYIEIIAMGGMTLAAANFMLHYVALSSSSFRRYLTDHECRFFLAMLAIFSLYVIARLWVNDYPGDLGESVRKGMFQTISILTSTGYTIDNYSQWSYEIPTLLVALSFFGGCAGSTCGGIKNLRIMLLLKLGYREVIKLLHPHGAYYIKHNGRLVENKIIEAVGGFVSLYFVAYTLLILALLMCGLDQTTAYSAAASGINNLGPALGEAATSYTSLPDSAKLVLCFAMILGRLEIFTLLIFFIPAFWRG